MYDKSISGQHILQVVIPQRYLHNMNIISRKIQVGAGMNMEFWDRR